MIAAKQLFLAFILIFSQSVGANKINDPDYPIDHCYHWLDEAGQKFLTYKYNYAPQNNGEFTFYTTGGNGAVAGPGIYCAKTLGGSYSYGDRVIRIDLVKDVVMFAHAGDGRKHCGHPGSVVSDAACQQRPWDIKFFSNGSDWYVIQTPSAIASWSANSDLLIAELKAAKAEFPGAATHFDNTITRINAERLSMGELFWSNQNSRFPGVEPIIGILDDKDKLNKIPPLSIIERVLAVDDLKVNPAKKTQVFHEQFARALKDTMLVYDDYEATFSADDQLKQIFLEEVKKLDFTDLAKVNSSVLLVTADRFFSEKDLTAKQIKDLWQAALFSNGSLDSIKVSGIKVDGFLSNAFDASIPSVAELMDSIKSYNLMTMLDLLNTYSQGNLVNPPVEYTKTLLQAILKKHSNKVIKAYDNVTNKVLKASEATTLILSELFAASAFDQLDPVAVGGLLDRVVKRLDSEVVKSYVDAILSLPLSLSTRATYMFLDDVKNGAIELPSFMPDEHYLLRLAERSIAERAISKTSTNTFRMVISGYFHYFFTAINAEDDATKKSQLMHKAARVFHFFAKHFTGSLADYRYAVLQNASLFAGEMQQDDHPIQTYFQSYKGGDSGFDDLFQEVIISSYDGSVLKFLINQASAGNFKAVELLVEMTEYLSKIDFGTLKDDVDFEKSQGEKRSWSNIIVTKNKGVYSGDNDRDRVYADICHFSSVIHQNRSEIKNFFVLPVAGDGSPTPDGDGSKPKVKTKKAYLSDGSTVAGDALIDIGLKLYQEICDN